MFAPEAAAAWRKRFDMVSRRAFLAGLAGAALAPPSLGLAQQAPATDATFLFTNDVHACRMASGLSPQLPAGGQDRRKPAPPYRRAEPYRRAQMADGDQWRCDQSRRRGQAHRAAKGAGRRRRHDRRWRRPDHAAAGRHAAAAVQPSLQQGSGPDRVHVPVYAGLGNHDLDQDGPPPHVDWYRRELRDYVEINHRPSVFFKPPVPATNYDAESDCYRGTGAGCIWSRRIALRATPPRARSADCPGCGRTWRPMPGTAGR